MSSTVLVIGASRGIGLEFVRQYRSMGWRVIATVRDDAARERLRDLGAEVHLIDVARPASVSGLAWLLDGERIDIALYVAGMIRRHDALTPPSLEDFDAVMHVNVLGAMQVIPQVAPLLQESGGVLACLSSSMSQIGSVQAGNAWLYRVSKSALNMAVAAAQNDYPGATLITIDPGWVQTEMGGEDAPVRLEDSVSGMRSVLASLTPQDKGQLLHHDGRRAAHW